MKRMIILVSALILMMLPTMVHAWSEDILSHFQVYITAEEEYNSNIDLATNRYKRGDYITTVSPGLRFSTSQFRRPPKEEDRFGIDLDFRAGFVFYAKEHDDNYISLNGTLNAWYAITRNFTFRVRDYLIRSDEVREADYSATAIEGQNLLSRTNKREPYYRNVFEPSVEYRFGRENIIALNYRNNIYEIERRAGEDSMENYINPRLTYWFDIRNGVSLEYGLTLADFENSQDWVSHMAMGRYTYRFNPNTSIFGEYTFLRHDFESPPFGESASPGYDIHRPSLGVEHAFNPTLSGSVQLGYFWQNPEKGSTNDGIFYAVSLRQRAEKTTYTISFQGGYTENYFNAENVGFTKSHRVIGRISHRLLERMTVGLFGSYDWAKYPGNEIDGKTPKDNIWAIGGDASYQILRWLTASLNISHRENRSNISERDYSEYRGILRITASF